MNPITLMQDLKQLRSTVRLQGAALALMGACLLCALVLMFNMVGRDRVVVTPPSIDKTFWVSKDRVSSFYLEQMGSFIAYLTLDVSPQSIDWKKTMLLQYVSPDVYGALQTRQDLEADRLNRLNATTQFSVAQLLPNEEAMNVTSRGGSRPSSTEPAPQTSTRNTSSNSSSPAIAFRSEISGRLAMANLPTRVAAAAANADAAN